MAAKKNYYTNPAFCQQSEFYNGQPLSAHGNIRQSPVGAQTPHRVLDSSVCDDGKTCAIDEEGVQEQEFYEEVVVDDQGFIKEKKFVIVAQNNEGRKYIQVPQIDDNRQGSRYALPPSEENKQGSRYGVPQQINYETKSPENKPSKNQNHRYEYIPMQEHDNRYSSKKCQIQEEVEVAPGRVHRYAVIQTEQETELTTKNGRYALVPVEDLNTVVASQNQQTIAQKTVVVAQNKNRYEYIQDPPRQMVHRSPTRYEYIQTSPKSAASGSRYEYIQQPQQQQRVGNPVATQKLHELLSTPKKIQTTRRSCTPQKMLSPQSNRKVAPPALSPIPKEAFRTPNNSPPKGRSHAPKAQQKLNYALGTRQLVQQDKRHTAIVAPLCSSPIHSVYSETTYSNKSESWMNLSIGRKSVQTTLTVAALMMLLCGTVTSGLCFYMISIMGRLYFLDFGVVSGFTCLILGLLGFRTRNVYWLPNRNYISGKKSVFQDVFHIVYIYLRPFKLKSYPKYFD